MNNTQSPLSVFLRGQRTYVQGSQILGRTGDWLAQLGFSDATLQSAKFTSVTNRNVLARIGDSAGEVAKSLNQIGTAKYRAATGPLAVSFFETGDALAPRIADGQSRLSSLEDQGSLSGGSRFSTEGSHEDYLAAVIETVKALHGSLGSRVVDIWFTAITGCDLPVVTGAPMSGDLKISPILARNLEKRRQTLSRVETVCSESTGAGIAPFNISFSCLIEEA